MLFLFACCCLALPRLTFDLLLRSRPSACRANDFNKLTVHDKYVAFAQELVAGMPAAVRTLREVAATEPAVSYLIGMLRLRGISMA